MGKLALGSVYIIATDFKKTVRFYEKLLETPVTMQNMERFAQFVMGERNISVMNAYFDIRNPDKVTKTGSYHPYFDDLPAIAEARNSRNSRGAEFPQDGAELFHGKPCRRAQAHIKTV